MSNIQFISSLTALLFLAACESDYTELTIDSQGGSPVVACLAQAGSPVELSLGTTVAITDSASSAPKSNLVYVFVSLQHPDGSEPLVEHFWCSADSSHFSFPNLVPAPCDSVFVSVRCGESASGSVVIPAPPAITDVSSSDDGQLVTFELSFADSPDTADFYQVEVLRRHWLDGLQYDEAVNCNFSHYFFYVASSSLLSSSSSSLGLLTDVNFPGDAVTVSFSCASADLDFSLSSANADSAASVIRLSRLSSDYYYFLLTAAYASSSNSLLSIFGSSELHSNVSGGYGIVGARSSAEWVGSMSLANSNPDAVF